MTVCIRRRLRSNASARSSAATVAPVGEGGARSEYMKQFFWAFKTITEDPEYSDEFLDASALPIAAMNVANEICPGVISDDGHRDYVSKRIISCAVSELVREDNPDKGCAASYAAVVFMLEDIGVAKEKEDWSMLQDVLEGCPRLLVRFFRQRVRCRCLDGIYSELKKTQPKTGKCHSCGMRGKRSSMFRCTGCHYQQYCSHECQRDDWPIHKRNCEK